ncbi:MAG: sigma-70 family RNA polymerase sigma factor [Chloroflexi bacterium]|nr:sigma-70 family RNA polymerase sigma factor [Chloroflexota bacterium]
MNDEQTLIARAQRGDVNAYQLLVREYEQIAFRTAWLITHDEHESADAAQDAFVRAFRALNSFRLGQPFRPWILRIVANQALNRVKSQQRRTRMTERFARQALMNEETVSPEHVTVAHEQDERLLQAVGRLDSESQMIIKLRYFIELPENQVADVLQIPLGTVKSRLHRTLAKLREVIRREFPDLEPLVGE